MSRVNRLYHPNGEQISDFDHTLTALQRAHGYDTEKNFSTMANAKQRHIVHHFIVSKTTYPPGKYVDLSLPVVSGQHKLSKRKVDNADARLNQVEGISAAVRKKAQRKINRLQREHW